MFDDCCKEHPSVELLREYPSEGNGRYVEYCPECRENSPIRQLFGQVAEQAAVQKISSPNSDYATALRVYNECMQSNTFYPGMTFGIWCEQRLNPAKAPDCA